MLTVAVFVVLLSSCDSKLADVPKTDAPKQVEKPKPADESQRFTKVHLMDTIVVEKQLLGKPFMPGGTLAQYKKGKTEFDMFVAKMASPTEAALHFAGLEKGADRFEIHRVVRRILRARCRASDLRVYQRRMDRGRGGIAGEGCGRGSAEAREGSGLTKVRTKPSSAHPASTTEY